MEEREDLDDYGFPKKKGDDESEFFIEEDQEPPVDFWTDFDWEQFCLIRKEDMMLKDALPGEAEKLAAVGEKEKQKPQEPEMSQEQQEKEDFEESDRNFDDRLNYEEYKSMQDRIFDRTLEKGMPGVLYNEQQLDKRYKFMCALAKCTDGPSLNTYKKVQMMIN